MTFFFGLHLILGGKLDVEGREDLLFGLQRYFQGKRKQEIAAPLSFQISGHTPGVLQHISILRLQDIKGEKLKFKTWFKQSQGHMQKLLWKET